MHAAVALTAALDRAERAELSAAWQQIETLPKHWERDGVTVLIFCPFFGVKQSHFEGGCWQVQEWRDGKKANPTHWMPIPLAPGEAKNATTAETAANECSKTIIARIPAEAE